MSYAHPGSIQVSVGECQKMIRTNIEQGDIQGVAKFVRLLKSNVSIYAEDHPDLWASINAIPPFHWDKGEHDAFEDEMHRLELLLKVLRAQNIFGYSGELAWGDSSILESEEAP